MKLFLAGLLAGCAVGVLVYVTFPDRFWSRTSRETETPAQSSVTDSGGAPAARARVSSPSVAAHGEKVRAPASKGGVRGAAELHVGEGCDFSTGEVLSVDAAARGSDVICADIHAVAVSIECPGGSAEAELPPVWIGRRPTREECFDFVKDAPEALPDAFAELRVEPQRQLSGIALVKARNGQTFKVLLVDRNATRRVLERTAAIRYEAVPSAADGGRIRLEGQLESKNLDEAASEALRKMLKRPAVPGDTFRGFVGNAFDGVATVPEKLDLPPDTHLGVASTLQSEITIEKGNGSVYLSKGIGRKGMVRVKTYAGVLVEGDVDGEIEVDSYAYLHITGNLNGTITCNSYATVLLDGDVRGLFRARSYVTLLLGGRFADPSTGLDAARAGWSTFFFRSYTSRYEIEAFPPSGGTTLHVRDSDLPAGRHEKVGQWHEVIVGAPLWQTL